MADNMQKVGLMPCGTPIPGLEADEIEDIVVDRHLSPEFRSGHLAIAKLLPEPCLGFRRVTAHGTGEGSVFSGRITVRHGRE
jgi:hypothetical protein